MEGTGLLQDVSPSGNKPFPVRYGSVVLRAVLVTGVTPNYSHIRNFHVQEGSFITDRDNENVAKVAVIGRRVAEKLFGDENPIGRHILIFRVPCQVVGITGGEGCRCIRRGSGQPDIYSPEHVPAAVREQGLHQRHRRAGRR
ncbi:MAG: ABC transporter permease [Desulfobacterales bacterium]|nr:ABC transporter permease [Desulfobacterales bacterium]